MRMARSWPRGHERCSSNRVAKMWGQLARNSRKRRRGHELGEPSCQTEPLWCSCQWSCADNLCGTGGPCERILVHGMLFGESRGSIAKLVRSLVMGRKALLQLRVLCLGLLQDGYVGVGVFPEREEILICRLGFGGVALQGVGATELEMRECSDG